MNISNNNTNEIWKGPIQSRLMAVNVKTTSIFKEKIMLSKLMKPFALLAELLIMLLLPYAVFAQVPVSGGTDLPPPR